MIIAGFALLSACVALSSIAVPFGTGVAVSEIRSYTGAMKAKAEEMPSSMDDDLASTSVEAIKEGRIDEAIKTYGAIYHDESQSKRIRAAALYQIGLMNMSPFNKDQNTDEAYRYLKLAHEEFPNNLQFCRNIFKHMDHLKSGNVLAAPHRDWKSYELRRAIADKIVACPDMDEKNLIDQAVAAIREQDAKSIADKLEEVATEPANNPSVRAAAYAQLGLLWSSKYNPDRDSTRAKNYVLQAEELDKSIHDCYGLSQLPLMAVAPEH